MIDLGAHPIVATGLILGHLLALGLAFSRFFPSLVVARTFAVLGLTLVFFFFEHFVGLGSLDGIWPLSTLASAVLLWRTRHRWVDRSVLIADVAFLAGFAWAFFWRYSFPSLTPSSEKITDLYFIANYMSGVRLPPPDAWNPSLAFDFYYGLQHYGAALLARYFDLSPALSYQLGFCVLVGLGVSLCWDFSSRVLHSNLLRCLVVATVAIGGTGASPFTHLAYDTPADVPDYVDANNRLWGGARFAGDFDQRSNTAIGTALFEKSPEEIEARSLPSENFGYQVALGDYHPPLGGFVLLLLAIALIGAIETSNHRPTAIWQGALGLSVSAQLATNSWVFPLQGLLVAGWMLWRVEQRRAPHWGALFAGGLAGLLLLYPFLGGITSGPGVTRFAWVRPGDFTPWPAFLATFWPVLILLAAGLLQARSRSLTSVFVSVLAVMLLISEVLFVDDPSSGRFERTNTTMKWWGYIVTASFAGLAPLVLSAAGRWARAGIVITLLIVNVHVVDQYRYWATQDRSLQGDLSGQGVYARDPRLKSLIEKLASVPRGIVLENVLCDAYCDTSALSMFAAQPVLLGWPIHQQTWRGPTSGLWLLRDKIVTFYAGGLSDPLPWLTAENVRYVLWTPADARRGVDWSSINASMAPRYDWIEVGREGVSPVGLWRLRSR